MSEPRRRTRLESAHLMADFVNKVLGCIALLVAAWWTYTNFTVERTHDPTMLVTLSPTVHPLPGNRMLLTTAVRPRRGRHQVETYLELLRADGVPVDDGHNENWLREDHATRVGELLAALPAARPRVLLVVRGTDCRRFWSPERWVELMRWLVEDRGCELFFCGGPPDAPLHAQLQHGVSPNVAAHVHDYSEALSLAEAAALVGRMNLCVSVDTGLVHLAASFHVPVVVLVGPTDPNQWAPWATGWCVALNQRRIPVGKLGNR